jgi:hypothetical protein
MQANPTPTRTAIRGFPWICCDTDRVARRPASTKSSAISPARDHACRATSPAWSAAMPVAAVAVRNRSAMSETDGVPGEGRNIPNRGIFACYLADRGATCDCFQRLIRQQKSCVPHIPRRRPLGVCRCYRRVRRSVSRRSQIDAAPYFVASPVEEPNVQIGAHGHMRFIDGLRVPLGLQYRARATKPWALSLRAGRPASETTNSCEPARLMPR